MVEQMDAKKQMHAKNHRNRLNHSCRKARFKNITNAQINRLGPP